MNVNYKGLAEVLIIIVILLGISWLIASASAEVVDGIDYPAVEFSEAVVTAGGPPAPLNYTVRIDQGSPVYLNETYDVSGVSGWPDGAGEYRLVYYGQWVDVPSPEDIEPRYVLLLPGKYRSSQVESQYRFWIDPAIFAERPGYWYQWTSNATRSSGGEGAGNLRAFKVINRYRPVGNETVNETTESREIRPPPLLPEKHVADYVVAKGDPLEWPVGGEYRLWMFGRVDGVYGKAGNILSADEVNSLENGAYTLVIQRPGNNTIYDATYDPVNKSLIPGLYGRVPVDVFGLQPSVVLDRLRGMLSDTDDTLETYTVEVDVPYITLDRADEMTVAAGTVLDVRGYSNVANGTGVFISLDETSYYGHLWVVNTTAVRTSPGNLSYYRGYVKVDWENLAADARNHTLIARTVLGGEVHRDFKISVMPADSYKPNATLKYIESSIPFVPTPTPEVIVKEIPVPGPKETIIMTTVITPDVQDYGKVFEGGVWWIGTWIAVGMGAMLGLMMIIYGISIWWRGRKGG